VAFGGEAQPSLDGLHAIRLRKEKKDISISYRIVSDVVELVPEGGGSVLSCHFGMFLFAIRDMIGVGGEGPCEHFLRCFAVRRRTAASVDVERSFSYSE